jgi:hypothetical protein
MIDAFCKASGVPDRGVFRQFSNFLPTHQRNVAKKDQSYPLRRTGDSVVPGFHQLDCWILLRQMNSASRINAHMAGGELAQT